MRDFLEHRRWPAKDDPALDSWGTDALAQFANHFSGLSLMDGFDLAEAQSEFSLLKKELREEPCFLFSYKKFWEHVSAHYDKALGYSNVLLLGRVSLLILADSSICERGHAWYNRFHTKERANLKLKAARSAFAVKNFGPSSIADFNAPRLYDSWVQFVAPDDITGVPGAVHRRRRNLAALMKKIMAKAVSTYTETTSPATGGTTLGYPAPLVTYQQDRC